MTYVQKVMRKGKIREYFQISEPIRLYLISNYILYQRGYLFFHKKYRTNQEFCIEIIIVHLIIEVGLVYPGVKLRI